LPEVPDVVENRQMYAIAANEMIRSLSLNPRFPVAEMERIRKEVNISPGAFTSPEAMRQRMQGVDRGLRMRLDNERRAMTDPNLSADAQSGAAIAVKDIENFLNILGVPQDRRRGAEPSGSTDPDLDALLQKYGG
jgi:hypothetical protein